MKHIIPILIILAATACNKSGSDNTPSSNAPVITTLAFHGDTLRIQGQFGLIPGVAERHVIVNEEPIPEEKVVTWKEDEIEVKVETTPPADKAVQVEVKGKKSNVKIITIPIVNRILRMDYLQVSETAGKLYIHGSFGNDPGAGGRHIAVDQFTNHLIRYNVTEILSWTPNLIICKIPYIGVGSHGDVIVAVGDDSVHRGLYQYNFIIDYNRPQGGATGSLAEKIKFYIWLRGDGDVAPASVTPLDLQTDLNDESHANWSAGGTGTSSYNNDEGCGTVDVQWQHAEGVEYLQPNLYPLGNAGWRSFVKHRRDGFDLKIEFIAKTVITSNVTFTPCTGDASTQFRLETIYFDEFKNMTIPLTVDHEKIKGNMLLKTGLSSTAGLVWDASVFEANLVTAYLKWNDTQGTLE